ncbi:hypothetical protein TNCV_1747871 [Trichonephila clavipes]|nr:hypothetical protein TNCV_1747871 [Trichonephila clavipes]
MATEIVPQHFCVFGGREDEQKGKLLLKIKINLLVCNKLGEVSVGREVDKMSITQYSLSATAVNVKPPLSNNTETEKAIKSSPVKPFEDLM